MVKVSLYRQQSAGSAGRFSEPYSARFIEMHVHVLQLRNFIAVNRLRVQYVPGACSIVFKLAFVSRICRKV